MRKKIICLIIAITGTAITAEAQSLSELKDSCYSYLASHDTAAFNATYVKLLDAIEKDMDPEIYEIRNELNDIRSKDQSIRILLMDAMKKYGREDKRTLDIRKIMREIDLKNGLRVQQIIDAHGWLGIDDIGEDANETLFLCIQHINELTVQTKYLPLLREAVKQGNAKGWHYAFLTDRILMNQGKPQVYGTQTITSNNKVFIVPLENPDKVDELRKEIGLAPLNNYMQDFGSEWSLDSYKKNLPEIRTVFQRWYQNKPE